MSKVSYYLIAAATLFLSAMASASASAPAGMESKCTLSPEFIDQSVVLVFDRTTIQSPQDIEQWKQAVHTIFESTGVGGNVRVMEVRDTDVTFQMSAPLCVRTMESSRAVPPGSRSGVDQSLRGELVRWMSQDSTGPRTNSDRDEAAIRAARQRLEQRAAVQKRVEAVIDGDRPTFPSAIIVPLFKVLQSECTHRKVCRIYLFSDLLDLQVRHTLERTTPSAVTLAQRLYGQNMSIYHPELRGTQLHIVSWGAGRNDINSKVPLGAAQMQFLMSFWSALFGRLCTSAAPGSSVSVTSLFTNRRAEGCAEGAP